MSTPAHSRVVSQESNAATAQPPAHGPWQWCDEFDARKRAPRLARAAVAAVCGARYDADTVVDVQLVVSELVTNCIEHAGADRVRLCLCGTASHDGNEITVTVTSATSIDGLPEPSNWRLPAATSRTGRGLAMIRRIGRPAVYGLDAAVDPGWSGVTVAIEPHRR